MAPRGVSPHGGTGSLTEEHSPPVAGQGGIPTERASEMGMQLPKQGIPRDALFEDMRKRKEQDADWRGGSTASSVRSSSTTRSGCSTSGAEKYR